MTHSSLFISHGSPMLALTPTPAHAFLRSLGDSLPRPRAVVVASPHFLTEEPCVVTDPAPETTYDFRGFPAELSAINYPAAGDPALAERVAELIASAGFPVHRIAKRGFDHGIWVPLSLLWPAADIPIVQLSIQPDRDAAYHFELGRALRPLLEDDVLVMGTGAMTHNLPELFRTGLRDTGAPVEPWAKGFADWIAEHAAAGDSLGLVRYRSMAPDAARAHPEDDHFLPFFVALGAAGNGAVGHRIHDSIEYGALVMDAYEFRAAA